MISVFLVPLVCDLTVIAIYRVLFLFYIDRFWEFFFSYYIVFNPVVLVLLLLVLIFNIFCHCCCSLLVQVYLRYNVSCFPLNFCVTWFCGCYCLFSSFLFNFFVVILLSLFLN